MTKSSKTTERVPSLRKHATGQWMVRLSGRDIYFGTDRKTARVKYGEQIKVWLANGRRMPEADDEVARFTVADVVARFTVHCQRLYRDAAGNPTGEFERNVRPALTPLVELFGSTRAAEFGPTRLRTLRDHLLSLRQQLTEDERKAGQEPEPLLARTTVNKRIGAVQRCFRFASAHELVPASTYHGLLAVEALKRGYTDAREPEPIGPAPWAHVEPALQHMTPPVRAMVLLCWHSGMRPGEACKLTSGHIDRSGKVWLATFKEHKTARYGRDRVVALGPQAQEVLAPWLKLDPAAPLFSPHDGRESVLAARRANRQSKRTPSQRRRRRKAHPLRAPGSIYTPSTFAHSVASACAAAIAKAKAEDKAPIEAWTPNQLRHAFATRVRQQHGLEAARSALGHRTSSITEQVYAEADTARNLKIAEQMG